jgi:adenine specific DNA methylase Mod
LSSTGSRQGRRTRGEAREGAADNSAQFLTSPNDLVIDIFAGSNTTGAVCEQLNRRWISFDLDQEYLAVSRSVRRWDCSRR